MIFELSITQLITICAIFNGFVFSFLLFEKKENRRANRFLALMIICMSLTFTPYLLNPTVWSEYLWLTWMPFSLSYWIGPSFYLYVKVLTKSSIKLSQKELLHFLPIVLNYIHGFYHVWFEESDPFPGFHEFSEYFEVGAILSIIIYFIIATRLLSNYQSDLFDCVSNTDTINLKWLRYIIGVVILAFLAILIFLVISGSLENKGLINQWREYQLGILLIYAGILNWISISGYRQSQIVNYGLPRINEIVQESNVLSEIILALQKKMEEEKLYRNPTLNLYDLSKATEYSSRSISDTLNNELQKNFYRFVNEYRVEEVKQKLKNPAFNHLKITSIAFDAGFNSKASFNRVFKSYTSMTPKEFRSKYN